MCVCLVRYMYVCTTTNDANVQVTTINVMFCSVLICPKMVEIENVQVIIINILFCSVKANIQNET